jgi:hypothetical protein
MERAERAEYESGRAEDDAQPDAHHCADGRRPGKLIDDEAEDRASHDAAGKHAAQAEEVAPAHRDSFGSTFRRKVSQPEVPPLSPPRGKIGAVEVVVTLALLLIVTGGSLRGA